MDHGEWYIVHEIEPFYYKWLTRKGVWSGTVTKTNRLEFLYKTEEEAKATLKKWFDTQPDEVFAEYIGSRLCQS